MEEQRTQRSGNLIILGIVLSIITYWLFAQAFLNIGPHVQQTYSGASAGIINLSISLTSLITGIFMVAAGNFSDKLGKVKITYAGIILSIIGSLLIIITASPAVLIIGRIVQGFSAALLMPATISIINTLFTGDKRRSALSYWSIGAFGGTGLASLFAGTVATFINWQWIFIISIGLSVLALFLLKDLKEVRTDKVVDTGRFDYAGLLIFIIVMSGLSIYITQGEALGWFSPISIAIIVITLVAAFAFYYFEGRTEQPFIDFTIFSNKAYIGTVIANFLMNTTVGSIALFNIYTQSELELTPFEAGLVTLPYVVLILFTIRVGEKSIKKYGAKLAIVVSPLILAAGVVLLSLTFLGDTAYIISCLIGFALFGIGIGLFATPALDTAVSTTPPEKVGVASAIFKMASTLGAAFGLAIIISLYTALGGAMSIGGAAMIAFGLNVIAIIVAFLCAKFVIPDRAME